MTLFICASLLSPLVTTWISVTTAVMPTLRDCNNLALYTLLHVTKHKKVDQKPLLLSHPGPSPLCMYLVVLLDHDLGDFFQPLYLAVPNNTHLALVEGSTKHPTVPCTLVAVHDQRSSKCVGSEPIPQA